MVHIDKSSCDSIRHPDPDGFHLELIARIARGGDGGNGHLDYIRSSLFEPLGLAQEADFALFWVLQCLPSCVKVAHVCIQKQANSVQDVLTGTSHVPELAKGTSAGH